MKTEEKIIKHINENYADTVIINGKVKTMDDNTFSEAVAIRDGKIIFVGKNIEVSRCIGKETDVIDVEGDVVSPGFIDIHNHGDWTIDCVPKHNLAKNLLSQGITTILCGNCGYGTAAVAQHLNSVKASNPAINYGVLTGHANIRTQAGVKDNVTPNLEQMNKMKSVAEQAMRDGAFGMSTGLEYIPGCTSTTNEIVEIAKVIAKYGGFYASHIRSETDGVVESTEEALEIGQKANIPVQISHIKVDGFCNWDKEEKVIELIKEARNKGQDVLGDQYPYVAYAWTPYLFIDDSELASGHLITDIKDPIKREKIKKDIMQKNERYYVSDGDSIIISDYTDSKGINYSTKTMSEILAERNVDNTAENLAELTLEFIENFPDYSSENPVSVTGVAFGMSEENIIKVMKQDFVAVATDSSISITRNDLYVNHPRYHGTYPMVLGNYVRDKGVISLDLALHKMTALPASRLGLRDRGKIKVGYNADITIFDKNIIADKGTYKKITSPVGIDYVLVNGTLVVDKRAKDEEGNAFVAELLDDCPGQIIYGPGYENNGRENREEPI